MGNGKKPSDMTEFALQITNLVMVFKNLKIQIKNITSENLFKHQDYL